MSKVTYSMEDNPGYHIGRTYKLMHFAIQKLLEHRGFDITTDQWIILIFLKHKGNTSQQFLSKITSKDKATITRVIDDLEMKKHVTRIPGTIDRREKMINLTKTGENFIKKAFPFMQKMGDEMMKNITVDEYESLKNILKKISDNIIEYTKPICKGINQKIENSN
jgi:MarR family transcriptional regulator, organic hydroperoxide resistance regulator